MEEIKKLNLSNETNRLKLENFYKSQEIKPDAFDEAAVLMDNEKIIAASARRGYLLLGFVIDKSYQGEGILDLLLSFWIKETFYETDTLFIFTKPEYSKKFQNNGFKELASTEKSAFLIRQKISEQQKMPPQKGKIGAAVIHANPFTLGHLHLIKKSKEEVDYLYVFLLSSNYSLPFELRLKMAENSLKNINGVELRSGGFLIISREIFPSYFLKEQTLINEEHAKIDALVFKNHIAKNLSITQRFLGEENFDPSTALYNKKLLEILPPEISVKIFPRIKVSEKEISASNVRKAFLSGDFETVKNMIPKGTLSVLLENSSEIKKHWGNKLT